jgi:LysM repeat protein
MSDCNCNKAPVQNFIVVQAGDNTSSLAAKLGVTVAALVARNPHIPRMPINGQSVFASLMIGQQIHRP